MLDVVNDYKYLGFHTDNRLNWQTNIKATYKREIFLGKQSSFNMCSNMLNFFYYSAKYTVLCHSLLGE